MVTAQCPYCRTDVEAPEAHQCRVCKRFHHEDCWQLNQGCAVTACAGGPSDANRQPGVPPRDPLVVVDLPEGTPGRLVVDVDRPRPSGRRARRRAWVTVLIIALLFVGLVVLIASLPST